jgi:hypothetical protein
MLKFFSGLLVGIVLGALGLVSASEWIGWDGNRYKVVRVR